MSRASEPEAVIATTALPTSYGSWVTAPIPCRGFSTLVTYLDYSAHSDATTVTIKMQARDASGDGDWHDVHIAPDGTSALNELAIAVSGNAKYAHKWEVSAYVEVKFLAYRDGTAGSAAMDVSGV